MESQLAKSKSGYLVGDKLTIADIACWGWVAAYRGFSFLLTYLSLVYLCFFFSLARSYIADDVQLDLLFVLYVKQTGQE